MDEDAMLGGCVALVECLRDEYQELAKEHRAVQLEAWGSRSHSEHTAAFEAEKQAEFYDRLLARIREKRDGNS